MSGLQAGREGGSDVQHTNPRRNPVRTPPTGLSQRPQSSPFAGVGPPRDAAMSSESSDELRYVVARYPSGVPVFTADELLATFMPEAVPPERAPSVRHRK